jgi:hypothetical protein
MFRSARSLRRIKVREVHEVRLVPSGPLAPCASAGLRVDLLLQSLQRTTLPLNGILLVEQWSHQALVVGDAVELVIVLQQVQVGTNSRAVGIIRTACIQSSNALSGGGSRGGCQNGGGNGKKNDARNHGIGLLMCDFDRMKLTSSL